MTRLGGRKFTALIVCVLLVTYLAATGADPASFGAIGLMYTAFCGGNAVVEWKHASGRRPKPAK